MATRRGRTAEERLERLLQTQTVLARVSRDIGAALELEPVLKTVLIAMRSVVGFRGGTIQLVDDRGCYIAATDPPVTPELASIRVPVGTGLSGIAVSTATTVYSPDLDADPRVDQVQRQTGDNVAAHSYLAVPLIVLGECIGAMQVDSNEVDAFDAEDITMLEGLATQVAGAIESARRYERAIGLEHLKDDFIERISHELRTPLTIVLGFTDVLLSGQGQMTPAEHEEALLRIRTGVNRLSGLLEEILYLSSLDAGSTNIRREEVAILPLANSVRDISVDPGKVVVDVDPDLHFEVDPLLLRHIVMQLVDNGLKYGGDAEISAHLDSSADELVVRVRDHGPGIPTEQRQLIFERFWRGQQKVAGMGLGLATVRRLAASMEAIVEVHDGDGGGTQVDVRIRRPARATGDAAGRGRLRSWSTGAPHPAPRDPDC